MNDLVPVPKCKTAKIVSKNKDVRGLKTETG